MQVHYERPRKHVSKLKPREVRVGVMVGPTALSQTERVFNGLGEYKR